MRIALHEVSKGRNGQALPLTSLEFHTGAVRYALAETEQRPTVLGLIASGRMRPDTGRVSIDGVVPLWTFGKITNLWDAAEANVRVNQASVEKERDAVRHDVRKAYFGLQLARLFVQYLGELPGQFFAAAVMVVIQGVDHRHRPGQGPFDGLVGLGAQEPGVLDEDRFRPADGAHDDRHAGVIAIADSHGLAVLEIDALEVFDEGRDEMLAGLFAVARHHGAEASGGAVCTGSAGPW